MSARAFLGIGHLPRHYARKTLLRHALAPSETLLLHNFRGAHEHNSVHLAVKTRFEQQRNVEHNKRRTLFFCPGKKRLAARIDERMDDRFEPGKSGGVIEHPSAKAGAVDNASLYGTRKGRLDEGHGLSAISAVNRCIRIINLGALVAEHCRGGRLAHANRAGKPKDEHQSEARISASMSARNSGVT